MGDVRDFFVLKVIYVEMTKYINLLNFHTKFITDFFPI